MSLAARTRDAVDRQPWLRRALAAGVVNYAAAAKSLDVEGDPDAIATALRRYAGELEEPTPAERDARIRLHGDRESVVADGHLPIDPAGTDGGEATVTASGEVDGALLSHVLATLAVEGVPVFGAGVDESGLAVIVPAVHGTAALGVVEDAVGTAPASGRGPR